MLALRNHRVWDVAVIGGGASGLGVALDALSRGLSVVLLEEADFAKGTSSRSTKLLHGGVRYLAQGRVRLVREALRERGLLLRNAPHVCHKQAFIIPIYTFREKLMYTLGLKLYDLMAGSLGIGRSVWLLKEKVIQTLPTIRQQGLKGGVRYYDGQFDDARLALSVARTCDELGGCLLNYMKVTALTHEESGLVNGVTARDQLSQEQYTIKAKAVVNATGVFADSILQMDNPAATPSITPSQGTHLVVDLSFLGSEEALLIPETTDGRVLFGIPWEGKLLLGTTDIPLKQPQLEPRPLALEIDFILANCAAYLIKPPSRSDVLAAFAGLRPLAAVYANGRKTKEISRSHQVLVSQSHLISIIGGKWTTFRQMGQDTVDALIKLQHLRLPPSRSSSIRLHGYPAESSEEGHLAVYGSDAAGIKQLIAQQPALAQLLHPRYPHTRAEVVWMVQEEMAMKVEDVLARRMRILFLDARAAQEMAPSVAGIMRAALGKDEAWAQREIVEFRQLAAGYLIS
nr:glycerol-3-phosphate dehydrogenase/oxidase [Pontibacter liquoris]